MGGRASAPWRESTCARRRPSDDDWPTGGAAILVGVEWTQPFSNPPKSRGFPSSSPPRRRKASRKRSAKVTSRDALANLSPTNREESLGSNSVIEREPLEKYEREKIFTFYSFLLSDFSFNISQPLTICINEKEEKWKKYTRNKREMNERVMCGYKFS